MEWSCEPPYRLLDFGIADDDGLAVELGYQVENYSLWRIPARYTVRILLRSLAPAFEYIRQK